MNEINLVIKIEQKKLDEIAEKVSASLLSHTRYECGEATAIIIERVKETLFRIINQYDYTETVRDIFKTSLIAIARDVVTDEIRKLTRKTVKDLHTRGELLNE